MAKISIKDITPIKTIAPKVLKIENKVIEIEQYLPLEKKAKLIESVLGESVDDIGFFSPMRLDTFFKLELMRFYTNLSITDKMLESPEKLFDALEMNGILAQIMDVIPIQEIDALRSCIVKCAESITAYQNSFVGAMKSITKDYDATKLNVEDIMKTLDQPDKIGLVKEILEKIG